MSEKFQEPVRSRRGSDRGHVSNHDVHEARRSTKDGKPESDKKISSNIKKVKPKVKARSKKNPKSGVTRSPTAAPAEPAPVSSYGSTPYGANYHRTQWPQHTTQPQQYGYEGHYEQQYRQQQGGLVDDQMDALAAMMSSANDLGQRRADEDSDPGYGSH